MARAVRSVSASVSRSLPLRAVLTELRAPHRRVVRAETSGRGFRGDLRRLADAALELAREVQELAGNPKAALPRPHRPRTGGQSSHSPPRPDRLHRGGHGRNHRGVLPGDRARRVAEGRRSRPRCRPRRHLRARRRGGPRARAQRRGAGQRASQGDRGQGQLLDRRAPHAGEVAGGGHRRKSRGNATRRGQDSRARADRRIDRLHHHPGDEFLLRAAVRAKVARIVVKYNDTIFVSRMKIGILYETSDDLEEYPGANLEDTAVRKKRKRPKLDREEVFAALTKLDHEPAYLELDGR